MIKKVRTRRSLTGIVLAILVVFMSLTPQMRSFYSLPAFFKLGVGDELGIDLQLPAYLLNKFKVEINANPSDLINFERYSNDLSSFLFSNPSHVVTKPGEANLKLKLFGLIPIKEVNVDVVPRLELIPGGHAIGILLKTDGVTVIGFSPVKDQNGKQHLPAKEAGLEIEDTIVAIEGITVTTDEETARLIDSFAQQKKLIQLDIQRGNKQIKISIKPVLCKETKRYRIGLYIKDSAAGVGTLTFYDRETQVYGALGHVIADVDINRQIAKGEGKIVNASIQGIHQARRGQPGEKVGTFESDKGIFGDIRKNTNYGIFGFLDVVLQNEHYREPIPVAFAQQVNPGPAEILTVINGNKIERFSVEIARVNPQRLTNGKNLIINITDPKLVNLTGGIIQGMSGSPIIQNGYLVGAVTHVLVNEPTRGYGILAEWMLMETDLTRKVEGVA